MTAAFAGLLTSSFGVASFEAGSLVALSTQVAVGLTVTNPLRNLACALQTEVWVADIKENLFRGMEFISNSVDDAVHVTNKIVHVPNAGAVPTVVKDRAVFPATIAERTDTDLTYSIANYTTNPIRVRDFDDIQMSYDKRNSVLSEHMSILRERIGDEMAYNWAPSASALHVLRTTGADATDNLAPGATGTRKSITVNDVARMAKKLDKDLAPKEGRILLLPADMYYELLGIDALIRADYMAKSSSLPDAVVNRLLGFDIMIRSSVVVFGNETNPVKKAVGAASAATDNHGAIAWSKFAVRHAVGAIKVYHNPDQAEQFGDIMSAEVNFGGMIGRTDLKGVVSLVQAS